MVKIINSLLPFTVEMCTLYPRILFGVLFQHFWSSFVYTVVCLFCNIACGSLIDSNLQNICHIFFKKYYLFAHTRWRRGCRLKVNVHVQRVQRGGGGRGRGGLSICTLWMTPITTGFLNFIFDYFKQIMFFIAELRGKCVPFILLESKITKEKATQHNIWIIL